MKWLGRGPLSWDNSRRYIGVQVMTRSRTQRRVDVPSSSLLRAPCGVPWTSDFGREARDDDEDVPVPVSFPFLTTKIPSPLTHILTPSIDLITPATLTSTGAIIPRLLILHAIGVVTAIVVTSAVAPLVSAIVIVIAPARITTATPPCAVATGIAAIGKIPLSPAWGWLS